MYAQPDFATGHISSYLALPKPGPAFPPLGASPLLLHCSGCCSKIVNSASCCLFAAYCCGLLRPSPPTHTHPSNHSHTTTLAPLPALPWRSYLIRSIPTISGDRIYCKVLAHNAVHAAFAGYTGVTMGLVNTHVSWGRRGGRFVCA